MERKISLADLQKTVDEAYENFKSIKEGSVDPLAKPKKDNSFGISVVLTDGTVVNKGDTDVDSPLGNVAKIGTAAVLLQQNTPEQIVSKGCGCGCGCKKGDKPKLVISAKGVRAVSMVQPTGDADGKYDVLINNLINMMGDAPVFDDSLYQALAKEVSDAGTVDAIESAGFTLYDKADVAVKVFTKLLALRATTEQAATFGATVAADGRNPRNGQIAFDGSIAANIVAVMAKGSKKVSRGWMMEVGLPARRSFGGLVLAVLPGFGAIAAYSPELDENGTSVKAAKAIRYIANKLGLNVYASARVKVEK